MAKDRRRGAFAGPVRSTLYLFAATVLIAALAGSAVRARDDYSSRPQYRGRGGRQGHA